MNVLHDGSKFSGPLRTHLHSATPRFIYRYQEIQYQIAHLTIATEAGDASNVERQDHDGVFLDLLRPYTGLIYTHTVQQDGQEDQEEENSGQHPEQNSEQHWQDQSTHEAEEAEAHEETVTGDISNHSEESLEKQEQIENADHTEPEDDNAGAEPHEVQDESSGSTTAVDIIDQLAANDIGRQQDSHEDEVRTDEVPVGEPHIAHADEEAQSEEHVPSADDLTITEAVRNRDESTHDNDDAQGLFHSYHTWASYSNPTICLDHEEQPSEPVNQSHDLDYSGHNGNVLNRFWKLSQISDSRF